MHRTTIFSLSLIALVSGCADQSLTRESESLAPQLNWSGEANAVIVSPTTMQGACQTPAAPVACFTAYPEGWLFYNDEIDAGDPGLGSFATGPGTTVLHGVGSAQISVTGSQRRNLATYQFAGTRLDEITVMKFTTYNPSNGNGGSVNRSAYLNFNVDFDGTDTWQRRLVFVPRTNGAVLQDTWQEWDAINSGNALWTYSGSTWPVTGQAGTTTKTWKKILEDYPSVRIRHTDAHLGLRVGEPYADGYVENISSFTFGTSAGTTLYDFEPEPTPPVVTNVIATPNPAGVGGSIALTADVSDVTTGNSSITGAEYSLDGLSWVAMAAADGAFDQAAEVVTVGLTAPAAAGIYDLCVRGTDANGYTSEPACADLVVYDPTAGFVTGGGWIQSPSGAAAQLTLSIVWDQGFEGDATGWFDGNSDWSGSVTRVQSGTNAIASYTGGFHAEMTGDTKTGPFSRFDAYRSSWTGTWVASVAVYLDPAWNVGSGFDYSVAANGSDGNHRRDYIFHITKDNSTNKLLIAGSNNTNFAVREDLESLNHYEITTAGWYVLRHTFRDQAGSLAVDLQLLDANGNVLFTETRFNAADLIPAEVGGNRYAWFTFISGVTLAVDDHQLKVPVLLDPVGKATFGFVSKYVKGRTTPTGQTEFMFTSANLNFHSAAYEWLIVNQSGANAQFKGSGTLNGVAGYSFMLWAGDGDKDVDALTLDTFRIKIWVTSTNQVVYDNQTDTVIAGGSIMIHVPKK